MQAVLNLIWDKLLPAMKPGTLPTDDEARQKLELRLAHLTVPAQEGSSPPSSFPTKKYVFPANDRKIEAVSLERGDQESAITLVARVDGVDRRIPCGSGSWTRTTMALPPALPEQPVAASGGWTADGTFKVKLCFYETPFIITLSLKIEGDELQLDTQSNVGFGPNRRPRLTGKAG
jgi:hypothetical protein